MQHPHSEGIDYGEVLRSYEILAELLVEYDQNHGSTVAHWIASELMQRPLGGPEDPARPHLTNFQIRLNAENLRSRSSRRSTT